MASTDDISNKESTHAQEFVPGDAMMPEGAGLSADHIRSPQPLNAQDSTPDIKSQLTQHHQFFASQGDIQPAMRQRELAQLLNGRNSAQNDLSVYHRYVGKYFIFPSILRAF